MIFGSAKIRIYLLMAEKTLDLKATLSNPVHIEGDIWLVACQVMRPGNTFNPLLKPLDLSLKSNEYTKKQQWKKEEDELLRNIVSAKGAKDWSLIANELNCLVHNRMIIRQGRQCRERWFNHVNPELNKGKWTKEEDELLKNLQSRFGNKWSEISKFIKGRNENSVKNRWKSFGKGRNVCEKSEDCEYDNITELDWIYENEVDHEDSVSFCRRSLVGMVESEVQLNFDFLDDLHEI